MTRAPCPSAQRIPAATVRTSPRPSSSSTRTGRMRACGAVSITIPATWVPWPYAPSTTPSPSSSTKSRESVGSESLSTKSQPGARCPANSGWLGSMPVSSTATSTPAPRPTVCACESPSLKAAPCETQADMLPKPSSKAQLFWRASAGRASTFSSLESTRGSLLSPTGTSSSWSAGRSSSANPCSTSSSTVP